MNRCVKVRYGHFFVSGRVQGVAFRWACRDQAVRRGLTGWVRNLSDGRVEVMAEGDSPQVAALRDWLKQGPPAARVARLSEEYSQREARHDAFEILY